MQFLKTITMVSVLGALFVPQVAFAIWTPAEPLVPCGGFNTVLVDGTTQNPSGDGTDGGVVQLRDEQPECNFPLLMKMADNVITFLTIYLSIPIAAIIFAFAGFKYITAGGNESAIKEAHGMFSKVVVGLLIALGAFLIVHTIVGAFLSSDTLNYLQENVLTE